MNITSVPVGRLDTESTNTAHTLTLSPTTFDSIFVECVGVTSYALDTPATTINIPSTALIDGRQYHLYTHTSKLTDSSITLTFTGSNITIYRIWVLNNLITIPQVIVRNEYDSFQRGIVRQSANRRNDYIPPLGGTPDGWLVTSNIQFYRTLAEKALSDTLVNVIRNNKNVTFFADPVSEPHISFQAIWPNPNTQIRYLNRRKTAGRRISFVIQEV